MVNMHTLHAEFQVYLHLVMWSCIITITVCKPNTFQYY